MDHCNDNLVFSDCQYGVRQRRECVHQLVKVFDHWSIFMDADIPVDTVFLDFRKAFNCIPHKRFFIEN